MSSDIVDIKLPTPSAATPRVSVIIPCYNAAQLVAHCLDSVFAQTFRDFEVIIVNDGSPDTSELEKVLEPYMSRIVYIRQSSKRPAGARNTGIAHAHGEFVVFLDSADSWMPHHLEVQIKQFENDPSLDLAYANSILTGGSGRQVDFQTRCPSSGPATFETLAVERCQIPMATVVARKAAIVKAGGFDESLARCDDFDMWLRTAFHNAKIGYIRDVTAYMAIGRPGGLGTSRAKVAEAYWRILENADRKLPLSETQRKLVRERTAEMHAKYLLEEGKLDLSAGKFARARERFTEANQRHKQAKLSVMLLGLKIAPAAFGKFFAYWTRRQDGASAFNPAQSGPKWGWEDRTARGPELLIRYGIEGVKHVFKLHRPGQDRLAVWPDDILLASYPKSGNNWIRFLIANVIFPDKEVGWDNIEKLIFDSGAVQRDLVRARRPRIIRTHFPFDPRFRRVICIVRDPRDIALSQYHYWRKVRRIEDDYPIERFMDTFLAGDLKRKNGSWGENVGSWLAARHRDPEFLLLRYEDLLADTARELTRVAKFVGFSSDPELLARAVERSSAHKMREKEKKEGQQSNLMKDSRQDLPFVRAAKSGGWRKDLPETQVARIESAWGDIMVYLGYELVTRAGGPTLSTACAFFPMMA
jgi:glycosyltransferase involved in cell wall biosynthesis